MQTLHTDLNLFKCIYYQNVIKKHADIGAYQ